ncbi:BTAD domain-containing putative transcriptional regulator [Dactylosporangium sp. NPDC005555]|uniref:BTAD domain-containing putative transcriptional regulator n=1 Tax=Dactylosporangium sp. NPDC005555 TaxID=3154889 RepID=UPI0033B93C39
MHAARSTVFPRRALFRALLGGLTALAGLACLAALPYLLWQVTDACWDTVDWVESAGQPLNGPLLILAAVTAAWMFWCWLLYATIADTVAVLRGGRIARVRLPMPLHRAVAAAAGLLGTALQPGVAAAGPTPASTSTLQLHDTVSQPTTTGTMSPLVVPMASTLAAPAESEPVIYVVKRGDALSRIARTELGDAKRWPEIYTLNRGTRFANVGGTLTNPDVIYPGWRLKIPSPAVTPPATTVQPPPATTAPPTVLAPPATTAPPTAPSASVDTEAAPPSAGTTTSGHRLTDLLPWLAVLGSPVALALLLRRRRSRTHPTEPHPTEPRPAAATAAPAPADPPAVPAAPSPNVDYTTAPAAAPDPQDTARQLVDAALGADPAPSVIIPRATLQHLLPDQEVPARGAALTITATVNDAIDALEAEVLHRARLVAEHDADSYADIRDIEALPQTVLITHADAAQQARITATVIPGHDYDIDAILIDEPPPGARRRPPHPAQAPTAAAAAAQPTPEGVHVRVIGDVGVLDRRGRPVPGLRGRAKELLTYLAVHRSGAELPDIMEALWPDATVTRAAERLSTEVSNLRRTVRRAAGDGSAQAVDNPGGRYLLNADLLHVDLWQLDQTLTHDNPSAPDRETHLRTAVALHTGDLAGNATYPWIEAAREQCRRHGIAVRQKLAAAVAATDPTEAAVLLDAAADIDPYSEPLARAAIDAYAGLGALDEARHRYDQLRTALADITEQPEAATLTVVHAALGDAVDLSGAA